MPGAGSRRRGDRRRADRHEDRRFGVIGFAWDEEHELPRIARRSLAAIARLMGGALERARLYDAERASRDRLDVLSRAGRVLGQSLRLQTTLRRPGG